MATNAGLSKEPTVVALSPAAALAKAKQLHDENQRKTLLLKEELKKKARQLIEQQIKDQKVLMKKFEEAKTAEEKSLILDLIKKLSETIEKEKEILKEQEGTGNRVVPAVAKAPTSVPPPQHLLRLNNKRLNTTNFLKTTGRGGMHMMHHHHAATAPPTGIPVSMLHQPLVKPSTIKSPSIQSRSSNPFSFSNVDNRPKQLLISGADADKDSLVAQIKGMGCQVEAVVDQDNGSFLMSFVTRRDAEVVIIEFYL
jgi:hypothetical protein